jgi:ribosomal protein S18 acetylase RimI-like enzyme
MDVQFRKAAAGDLETMQGIATHTIDTSYRSFVDDEAVDWFISGPSDDYLRQNIDDATVVVADGRLVGFAVCKGDLIDLLLINHESHHRGLGSALLAHCESELFRRYESITLQSLEGNGRANAFYRKHGWVRIGAAPDTMSGGRKWILEKKRDQ